MRRLLPLALVALSPACGLVLGVDERSESFSAEHGGEGIDTFVADDLRVEGDILLLGGQNRFRAEVRTTLWTDDAEQDAVDLALAPNGSTLRFELAGRSDGITIDDIELGTMGSRAEINVKAGSFEARAHLGDMDIRASGLVTLEDCEGRITIDASSATVRSTAPADVVATGDLTVSMRAGTVEASTVGLSVDAVEGPISARATGGEEARISAFLPRGDYTLVLQADGGGSVTLPEFSYDSSEEEEPLIRAGIEVDIGDGGPIVALTSQSAIFVYERD